ncbi:MAG: chorismate synthase [Clostridia bacterium]|nr:chorismate synthase [Clostridia bacterium]
MASEYGKRIRVSVFGESHGPAVGAVISGLPAGEDIDANLLRAFMARRQGGKSGISTARREEDEPRILSGVRDGHTTGSPLALTIENACQRSADYADLAGKPRPGHADYTASVRYRGFQDPRGGGHFSGRLTAPLCAAGGICLQLLSRRGVRIYAHACRIAGIDDTPFDPLGGDYGFIAERAFPTIDESAGERMIAAIGEAAADQDSAGGVVECMADGVPAGVGDPIFDGVENALAGAMFALGGVRGIEFGEGFRAADLRGSQHNDGFFLDAQKQVRTRTNRHAGILGGITSGMPILFRVAFKPTASIGKAQRTVNLHTLQETEIKVGGRHDPCIVPRAVPCVEAVTALVLADYLL